MRISDWSSDVCSSDLHRERPRSDRRPDAGAGRLRRGGGGRPRSRRLTSLDGGDRSPVEGARIRRAAPELPEPDVLSRRRGGRAAAGGGLLNRYRGNTLSWVRIPSPPPIPPIPAQLAGLRSAARRVGKECVSERVTWLSP